MVADGAIRANDRPNRTWI